MTGVIAAFNAGFAADGIEIAYGTDDLLGILTRPNFDPERQTVVVDGPSIEGAHEGAYPGFGAVGVRDNIKDKSRTYTFDLAVHPAAIPLGLHHVLGAKLVEIARSMEADPDREPASRARITSFISSTSQWLIELFGSMGFHELRRYYLMTCPLDDLETPAPVEGVTIRPYRQPADSEPTRAAYNNSFRDHFDSQPATQEQWEFRHNLPNYRLDISSVAEIDAEPGVIAAFCLCGAYEEENRTLNRNWGFIELLGTVREWRKKGLGRSILLHGLHALKGAGFDTGMLGVDSDSLTGATRLYESVGFTTHSLWLSYEAALNEITV